MLKYNRIVLKFVESLVYGMRFIKDNSYDIVKLFVNQMGITIFSLVLYTAVGAIEDEALYSKISVLVSVFSTIFYLALIYTAAWDYGARDKIRIDGGKLEAIRGKGALLSLIANIPNFILASLAIITMLVYLGSGSDVAYTAFGVANLILRFINAMFLGALQGIFASLKNNADLYFLWQSVGYLIAPIITVLVTQLGYELGMREFKIFKPLSQNEKQ